MRLSLCGCSPGTLLVLAACASSVQHAYIAPTSATVFRETEQGLQPDHPSHAIYIVNRSTVPVTVFGMALLRCENIRQRCEPRSTDLKVSPGTRSLAMRVEPEIALRSWNYAFTFSWRADSAPSTVALRAMAQASDSSAQRTDVADRDLTRAELLALRSRAVAMRAEPESLALTPGERTSLDRVRLLILDDQRQTLGRTRWVRWRVYGARAVEFLPPDRLIATRPGRGMLHFSLVDEVQNLLENRLAEVDVPIVVAYVFDEHSPAFSGIVRDADSKAPLQCARVALEDATQAVVNRTRSDARGAFTLRAPEAGTYHVRVELDGWTPALGPAETAQSGEAKQGDYPVRFTEQQLLGRAEAEPDMQRARIAGVTAPLAYRADTKSLAPAVTLGGTPAMPILGVVASRVPPGTIWAQFAVTDTGRADTMSVVLTAGAAASARASIMRVLPLVRFSPAREAGRAVCEMVRIQVNFSPR